MERDQEFVLMVVKYLVENPDDVKVDRKIDEMGVLLTLTVNPEDMGKIIGKEGRTAKAIRTLLRVIGARMDARVNLKIEEPEGSTFVRPVKEGVSVMGGSAANSSDNAASSTNDDSATSDDTVVAANDDDAASDDDSNSTAQTPVADDSGFSQPGGSIASTSDDTTADFDPLATSKSIYGEDTSNAGTNHETDTSKPNEDENPTSIL